MELEEKRRLMKNWRGRRLLACRAIQDLCDIAENLGVEENSDPLPEGFESVANDQMKLELQNQAANLLRMLLILNDGHVSTSKLQRF